MSYERNQPPTSYITPPAIAQFVATLSKQLAKQDSRIHLFSPHFGSVFFPLGNPGEPGAGDQAYIVWVRVGSGAFKTSTKSPAACVQDHGQGWLSCAFLVTLDGKQDYAQLEHEATTAWYKLHERLAGLGPVKATGTGADIVTW